MVKKQEQEVQNEMEVKNTENLLLSPKYDVVFHALFKKGNENIAKALIQDITQREYKIINMDKNVILLNDNIEIKNEVLDLKVELDDGELCNIEIQLANRENFKERMLEYWAKIYSSQLKKGDSYKKLRRTILIAIVDFNIKEFINENYHTKWKIREEKNKKLILTNDFEIHIIEMKKAIKALKINKKDKIAQWMSFFDNPNSREVKNMSEENKDINEALEQLRILSSNPELRERLEREERAERDRLAEIEYVTNRAIEKGEKQGKKEIIKKLIESGMKIEKIENILQLSKEEIEKIVNS